MSKRTYFNPREKTQKEIEAHREQKKKDHNDRMRECYRKKKKKINKIIKSKFDEIYTIINSLDGYADITEIENNLNNWSSSKLKCLCFEKLYEACNTISSEE